VQAPHPLDADPAARLLLAFTRLARDRKSGALPNRFEELAREGVLAPRHFRAFAVIAIGGPIRVSELAAREGCALSTASLLVTQLAEAGLVERREDDADRRCTVVSVAPAYRRASEQILKAKLAPLRRGIDRLGPAKTKALLDGLAVLAEEMAAENAPADRPLSPVGSGR
jgi:DNA-binding MarR family transcriptional regulator